MRASNLLVGVVLGMGLVLWGNSAHGEQKFDTQDQRSSLHGLLDAVVKVGIGMSLEGPTRRLLFADVERRLKEIPLTLRREEASPSPTIPTFVVEVAMLKTGERTSVHFVTIKLYQLVTLVHDKTKNVYASTWTASAIGDGNLDSIRERIDQLLVLFIRDYQWANASSMN